MRILFVGLVFLAGGIPASGQIAGDAIKQSETDAYLRITQGEIWDGTVALVDLLRAIPGNDPVYADSMVGPAQLLGFSIAFLLDWDERRALQNDYLKPDEFVTDRLLIAGVKVAADLGRDKFLQSYADFREIAQGEHEAARIAALCFLADPYYFKDYPDLPRNTAELFLHYGDRSVARNLLRQTVCKTLSERLKRPSNCKTIFSDIVYSGGRPEPICAMDPVIARAAGSLSTYNLDSVAGAGPEVWARLAGEDSDDEVRYLSLRLLAATDDQEPALGQARVAACAAAARVEDTRDAALARGMALEYARAALEFDEMGNWATRLLEQRQLPGEPERCLYEWEMRAIQHAAETYTRYGYHKEAQRLYRGLAEKYPESELAEKSLALVEELVKDPLGASMKLIQREARHRFARDEFAESAAFYREVARRTPHASLASACQGEAESLAARALAPQR